MIGAASSSNRKLKLRDYDYLRNSPGKRMANLALMCVAVPLLTLVGRVFLGFRFQGRAHLRRLDQCGAVGVCNHVHWLDCAMLARALCRKRQFFVTLQSNMEMPLVRWLVKLLGGLPVPRERRELPAFSAAVDAALQAGAVVHIYPEGMLEPYCRELRAFKNGAFSHAYSANVPLIPMRITYREPRGLYRLYKRKPCMTLHVLPPVYPDPNAPRGPEIVRLREACRLAMERAAGQEQTLEAAGAGV